VGASPAVSDTTLAHGAIGLREVIFQSVAFMGCGATIVSSLPLTMAYAGGAALDAAFLCLLALLTVALSIAALSAHLPSAGSFYTYASRAIHPNVGFLVGWLYSMLTVLVVPLLVLILAATLAATHPLTSAPGLWWVYALIAIVIVSVICWLGVQTSSVFNVILGIFELTVFLVVSIWLIFAAGDRNTFAVFGTKFANIPGHLGFGGIIVGMIFTVLAFSGFESAAPLAEESRAPRRTIGRAVVIALLVVAGVELVSIYAATVYWGPKNMGAFASLSGGIGANWELLAGKVWGAGWLLVLIAVLNSCLANSNAGANTITRTLYAFGRIRVLPRALGTTDARRKSPQVAVAVQFVLSVAITLGLGIAYGPSVAFGILGTIIGIAFALLYIVINLSCFLYFWRQRRHEFTWWRHALIPAIGIAVLIPVFFAGAGLPVFSFISPLTAPYSYAGPILLIWMIIGLGYLFYMRSHNPQRIQDTSKVFLMEETDVVEGIAAAVSSD
jgi:amino acid transporter